MYKTVIIAISIFGLSSVAATAQEQAFYGDIGGGVVQGEVFDDATYGITQVRAGFDFNRHIGVELEGAIGVVDQEYTNSTESINFSYGAFGRLKYPINRTTEIYTRAGMVNTELENVANDGSFSVTVEDTGVAFGAGLTTLFAGRNGLRLDYTRLNYEIELIGVPDVDVNADAFTLSLYRRF